MYELLGSPVRHKARDPDGEFCLHLLQADWEPLWLELIQMMPQAEILEDTLLPTTPCSTGQVMTWSSVALVSHKKYSREVHMWVIFPEASQVR